MERENQKVRSVVLDGVEYVNQENAARMTKLTVPTFKKRVQLYGIEIAKVPTYKKVLYRKQEISDAIEKGYFQKWYE